MLSKAERLVLEKGVSKKENRPVCKNYQDQIRKRVRKKARIGLKDLELIITKHPEDVDPEQIISMINTYFRQNDFTITKFERPLKKNKLQVAGVLHKKDGSPLRKRLGKKYALTYKIANLLYELQEIPWAGPSVITDKGNGKFDVIHNSNLTNWLEGLGMVDISSIEKYSSLLAKEKTITDQAPSNVIIWRY